MDDGLAVEGLREQVDWRDFDDRVKNVGPAKIQALKEAGVRNEIFCVSSYTGEGIESLLEYLAERGCIA